MNPEHICTDKTNRLSRASRQRPFLSGIVEKRTQSGWRRGGGGERKDGSTSTQRNRNRYLRYLSILAMKVPSRFRLNDKKMNEKEEEEKKEKKTKEGRKKGRKERGKKRGIKISIKNKVYIGTE